MMNPFPSSPPETEPRSAADLVREAEAALAARRPPPDSDPALREIARVAAELLGHPRVARDADARRLLEEMAEVQDMERFDALADALRQHLLSASGEPPPPAPPRAARFLLRL